MKTIMQDIAKAAGVSPGTVSNALNDRKGVSKEKKEKILQIAQQMGYYKENKDETKIIRFVIFKKHGFVVSDTPFFSELLEGIEGECRAKGFEVIVSQIIQNEHSENDIKDVIKEKQIDGMLLLATEMVESDLAAFEKLNIPVVILDNYFNDANYDQVLINNSQGAYQAVKYLADNGHKEIGCLGSSKLINNFRERYEGFQKALIETNLSINHHHEVILEPTLEGAYRDMKEVLSDEHLKLPTAYFAFNDIIAFGAMRALKEKGIEVPGEVSIIGLDDMPFCEISSPRLSTIRVYKQYMGKVAVKRLMERIVDKDYGNLKIEVNTELIERESVKNI